MDDKWAKIIITILIAVTIWAVFMMTLLTFQKLGVIA